MRRLLSALVACAVLSACVGIPPEELPSRGRTTTLISPVPPKKTLERVLLGSQACYRRSFEVVFSFSEATQTGSVSVSLRTPTALSSLYVVNIRPAPEGAVADVSIHPESRSLGDEALVEIRRWVGGNPPQCTAR